MSQLQLLLLFFLAIFLYHLAKRLFSKGKIVETYIDIHDKIFLYLMLDYETYFSSRWGITASHCFKIKKINLRKLSAEYEVKIASFGSRMSDGFAAIFGLNSNFIFAYTDNDDLIIVNNKTGKIQCTKKQIIQKNPKLANFSNDLLRYSNSIQSIVIFDNKGYAYVLDPETIIAKQIDLELQPDDRSEVYKTISDFPSVNMDKKNICLSEPHSIDVLSRKYEIDFISEKGSKKYFIYIKPRLSDTKPKELIKSFINPKIMNIGLTRTYYLTGNPPSVVIVYSVNLQPKAEDIYLSRVNAKSEELWKHPITEIILKPKLSEDHNLYFIESDKKLFFICVGRTSHKFSISVIEKYNGTIINKPILFVNKRLNFLTF